jgi:prepilin-type N-terminal cleavage/methylation domain-containing protein
MSKARRAARRGFTLIEAIIAVVIIALAVPPMLMAMGDAARQRVAVVQATRARWLATEMLEDVIADRHSATRGWAWVVNANYAAENPVSGFPGFTRSVSVVETGASLSGAGTGYKTVTVSVGWTDAGGTARSLALSTVVTDYTP